MTYEIKSEVTGKTYPFVFGYRMLFALGQSRGISLDEATNAVSMDFDVMLEAYATASRRGAQKTNQADLSLQANEIEDMLDDDPDFAQKLMEAFGDAMTSQFAKEGAQSQGKPKTKARAKR